MNRVTMFVAAVAIFALLTPASHAGENPFDDHVRVCIEVFARAFLTGDDAQSYCSCVARESKREGMKASTMRQINQKLSPEDQIEDAAFRKASATCFDDLMDSVNGVHADEPASAPVRYVWSGWMQEAGQKPQSFRIRTNETASVSFSDGTMCSIGPVEPGEANDGDHRLILMTKRVTCEQARIEVVDHGDGDPAVGCSHSQDLVTSNGGKTNLKVYAPGSSEWIGSLTLQCKVEPL